VATFLIVDVVPKTHSDETWQDAEPSIGVNQFNPSQIVISAFTPPDPMQTNGPLYVSVDGGNTWNLSFIVPGGEPNDQTFKFGTRSSQFYGGDLSDGSFTLNALGASDPFVAGTMTTLETQSDNDQPFIESITVPFGPDAGKDRVYIGLNDLSQSGVTGHTAAIDVCLDATAATPAFTRHYLDTRSTGTAEQDGPQVRTAVHPDGTVYAVFAGWRSQTATGRTSDVVVVRDDNWASGSTPFTALLDPPAPAGDGRAGRRVQQNVSIPWLGTIGQQRVGGSFAIAVSPADSDIVYLCWAGLSSGVYTLNVQRSTDRGVTWSAVLLSVANATNPALAIASNGKIGFLYQQVVGTSPNDTWDTHFQDSINGTTWNDTLVATTPASTPLLNTSQGLTYIGDYLDMVAVGKNFFGTFCANNSPTPTNFPATPPTAGTPNGAVFLRNVAGAAPWNLLGTNGTTVVDVSIDPFFLLVTELPAYSDFYVRDWTTSPTSADTGLEPSTNPDFYSTSDVWNQSSSTTPNPPNALDQPVSQNAFVGNNYAFARIRRNALPPVGSGSTTVTAHFLVSEFGTGSNFVDALFSDPSDPDIIFPSPIDVTVTFADTQLGPLDTPDFPWVLGPTTSDHLCLAVEITSAGDPVLAPGLTGRAPGVSGTDPSVIADNNKAQRNLQVTTVVGGANGAAQYGIVHNQELFTKDVVIGLAALEGREPDGAVVEVVTPQGIVASQPWRTGDRLTLPAMTPGENRWIGVRLPVAARGATTASLVELKGDQPVNGFAVAAQTAPVGDVIASVLATHATVLNRLDQGFHLPAAAAALEPAGARKGKAEGIEFHERVHVAAEGLDIEVDVQVTGGRGVASHASVTPIATSPSGYEAFVRRQVPLLEQCLVQLGAGDPFDIAVAISSLVAVPESDVGSLINLHITIVNRFDAFLTMLQKAQGDRADILQMVRWHLALCDRPALTVLPATAAVSAALSAFVAKVTRRTMQLSDYQAMLIALVPGLTTTFSALGHPAPTLIGALASAANARAAEKAHRDLLLQLQMLVG
jgi:hypothetical protein